jgi:hypothetical protein
MKRPRIQRSGNVQGLESLAPGTRPRLDEITCFNFLDVSLPELRSSRARARGRGLGELIEKFRERAASLKMPEGVWKVFEEELAK